MGKESIKTRLKQDVISLSALHFLPHAALLFTCVAAVQLASTVTFLSRRRFGNEIDSFPNIECVFVFILMVLILVKYRREKPSTFSQSGRIFSKLSILCFIIGALVISAGIAYPMFSILASGTPLLIAGLLDTLLTKRKQLNAPPDHN